MEITDIYFEMRNVCGLGSGNNVVFGLGSGENMLYLGCGVIKVVFGLGIGNKKLGLG